MEYNPRYNEISEELKKRIPVLKNDETITFKAMSLSLVTKINEDNSTVPQGVYPASQTIPNIDRILDPGTNEYVDIAYITGQAPATRNGRGPRPTFGSIEFLGARAGQLTLTKKDQPLINYLSLCNYNSDSVNPEKQAPKNGFIFEQVKPAEDAKAVRKRNILILEAKAKIEEAEGEELDILRETANIPAVEGKAKLTEDEIKNRLDAVAERDPQFIINATSEVGGKLRVLIRKAEKQKLIKFVEDAREWRRGDSNELITGCHPSAHPENTMVSYLQATGKANEQTLAWLEKTVKK